ncbi:UreD-domain-containing protein [Artomyces pyxidatus]|uniref:UreD-domain-containing protein n=1 Tax=Artomyces pyxidatus TaxID=48021 RepID=A0ACB8TH68_9AGAM|nr:UreD-domain-containing protein [Artomyces pyxidatus]
MTFATRYGSNGDKVSGRGQIIVQAHGSEVAFPELSYSYPLKLLSPRIVQDGVGVVYMLTYGGGLVGGDSISLSVDVQSSARLVLLSQGSTKVFKSRPGRRAAVTTSSTDAAPTKQQLDVHIADAGGLFLLPDPVTCFRAASYHQVQRFHLVRGASAALLDWYTSGRRAIGEEWVFARYHSTNEVFVDGSRVARDAMLLDGAPLNVRPLPARSLADRMGPYACYATLILYGPLVEEVVRALDVRFQAISVFQVRAPLDVLWSLSPVRGQAGRIVRVAGKTTENVKGWLKDALRGLESVVGVDVYSKAFV